jgi:hypothetical protein
MSSTATIPRPVTEYIEASNTFDGDRMIAAFAEDALVNDAKREFWGAEAIKRWLDKEVTTRSSWLPAWTAISTSATFRTSSSSRTTSACARERSPR